MNGKSKETTLSRYVIRTCEIGGFTLEFFSDVAKRSLDNKWSYEEQAKSECMGEKNLCAFILCARLLNFIDDEGNITWLSLMAMTTIKSDKKQCKNCKMEVNDKSKYCQACGAQLIL